MDSAMAAEKPAAGDEPAITPAPAAPKKLAVIADLNVDPPESDGEDCTLIPVSSTRSSNEETNQVKSISKAKDTDIMEIEDADQQCQGVSVSREEKVSSLKACAVSVLSSLLDFAPDNLDALANLGKACLQRCFQDLPLKDQNHPAALVNYTVVLLSKYGSVIAVKIDLSRRQILQEDA